MVIAGGMRGPLLHPTRRDEHVNHPEGDDVTALETFFSACRPLPRSGSLRRLEMQPRRGLPGPRSLKVTLRRSSFRFFRGRAKARLCRDRGLGVVKSASSRSLARSRK